MVMYVQHLVFTVDTRISICCSCHNVYLYIHIHDVYLHDVRILTYIYDEMSHQQYHCTLFIEKEYQYIVCA